MTDQPEEKGPKLPPKIKLDLSGVDSPPTPPANLDAKTEAPPKAKISLRPVSPPPPEQKPAEQKPAEVKKISLNMDEALKAVEEQVAPKQTATEAKEETKKPMIKLNLSGLDQEDTSQKPAETPADTPTPAEPVVKKEEAPEAEPAKPSLSLKKKPPEPAPEPPPAEPEKAKTPEAAEESKAPEEPEQAKDSEEESKDKSIQIQDIEGESLDDLYQAALNATQRVILDEKEKAATNRIQADEAQTLKKAELAEANKASTARLDLEEMLSDDERQEIMKHETMHINADGTAPKPSGTMKIQRPATPPPEATSDSTMPIPLDLEESKKSETARIELPRDVAASKPPSGRKTIRIKRPDGSGAAPTRPALNVARTSPPPPAEGAASTSAAEAARAAISFDSDESDESSPAFAAVALVGVLVSLALVYVLAATLFPALPFPGRLV